MMQIKSAQEMLAERASSAVVEKLLPVVMKAIPPDVLQAVKLAKEQLPQVMGTVYNRLEEYSNRLQVIEEQQLLILNKLERIIVQSDPAYTPDSFPEPLKTIIDDLPTVSVMIPGEPEESPELRQVSMR